MIAILFLFLSRKGKIPGPSCGQGYACAGMATGPDCKQVDTRALKST